VPRSGRVLVNAADANLERVLAMGCWSERENFGRASQNGLGARLLSADGSHFSVLERGQIGSAVAGEIQWDLLGDHNVDNALAALGAARHAGVPLAAGCAALAQFRGVKRRMELRGVAAGVTVYDDFAHHPTAIATTLAGLRQRVGAEARIVAVLEPRSNTMRLGVHREHLGAALAAADLVVLYAPADLGWDTRPLAAQLGARGRFGDSVAALVGQLAKELRPGDHVLIMSNGGFGGLHDKLLQELQSRG
jgi:UDP-N-acetylmuramate: L-alanyl-gamma-D-glutamyl-meso-diaminopimelate ligase